MGGELFPIISGLLIGLIVGLVAPKLRLWVGLGLSVMFGVFATILSGEYEISWTFLLIDVPMVAVSASCAFLVMRRVRLGSWIAH